MSALQTRRDSLSPDSAAVMDDQMGGSSSKNHRRRDSRPHLSPDASECGGGGGGGNGDGSPRGSRIRRQSTTTEDIYKWVLLSCTSSLSSFLLSSFLPSFLLFRYPISLCRSKRRARARAKRGRRQWLDKKKKAAKARERTRIDPFVFSPFLVWTCRHTWHVRFFFYYFISFVLFCFGRTKTKNWRIFFYPKTIFFFCVCATFVSLLLFFVVVVDVCCVCACRSRRSSKATSICTTKPSRSESSSTCSSREPSPKEPSIR